MLYSRECIVDLVHRLGYQHRDEPFELASGELSQHYVDGKAVLAHGADLAGVAGAVVARVREPFDAVGGLTMGADPLAHAVAIAAHAGWFTVRKTPKGRGHDRWVEGAQLGPGMRVLLVEDVVTTAGSIASAHDRVVDTGATVVAAATLVDRGDAAEPYFHARAIPYYPLVGYADLGIPPVAGPDRSPTR